ncbi:MAG: SufD family Fe-S cluster assembly protein, partial [Pseudomonadota bacterium]
MQNLFETWSNFQQQQSQFLKGPRGHAWLSEVNEMTTQLKDLSYPSGEAWRYVDFGSMPRTRFEMPETDLVNRQDVDGDFYSLEINQFGKVEPWSMQGLPQGVVFHSHLEEFERAEQDLISDLFAKSATMNGFAKSALCFVGLGGVLRISDQVQLDKPIKVTLNLNDQNQKDALTHFHLCIQMGAGGKAEVLFDVQGRDFIGLSNVRVDAIVGDSGSLSFYGKQSGGAQSHFVQNLRANVSGSGTFNSFDFTLPSKWSRHDLDVHLLEKDAQTNIYGVYLNNQDWFSDHHTSIRHWVGETLSNEDYRGILADSAKAVFNGLVRIEEKASKSFSEQINKNLVLSKKAEVNTKPELQIFNDDVKAAHGATVGQIDEEQL